MQGNVTLARGHLLSLAVVSIHNCILVCGSLLNDLVDAFESFEFQIANDDNNHDFHMDMWTFESSMGLWTSGGELTFCCLVFVCHCYQHVPLIASTWVRTIVP